MSIFNAPVHIEDCSYGNGVVNWKEGFIMKMMRIFFLLIVGTFFLVPYRTAGATIDDSRIQIAGITYDTPISTALNKFGKPSKPPEQEEIFRSGKYEYRWTSAIRPGVAGKGPTMYIVGKKVDGEIVVKNFDVTCSRERSDEIATIDGVCPTMPIKILEEVYGKPDYIFIYDSDKYSYGKLKEKSMRRTYYYLSESGDCALYFKEGSNKKGVWTGLISSIGILEIESSRLDHYLK